MKVLLLLAAWLAQAAPASSIPMARLRGLVVGRGGNDPLPGASLTVEGATGTAPAPGADPSPDAEPGGEADSEGRFSLPVVPGKRHLQIQQPGYEPLDVVIELAPGEEASRTFRLTPRLTGQRYETVVTVPDERGARLTLRDDELTKTAGSFGDPFRVMESLPGVSQVVWPLAIYAIRGANPGNTGFFLDGIRVPSLYHFALGPSVIHPYFLEQVDFYPGGYPIDRGRFISGIVSAQTAAPKVDRVRGSVDVRLFDAGGIVTAPWDNGKGTIAVAGRLSYTALLFSAFSSDYTLNYWDYQARIDHTFGPGKLTLFVFGSGDTLGRKTDPSERADLTFHRVDLRWQGQVGQMRLLAGVSAGYDSSATSVRQLVSLPISSRSGIVSPRLNLSRPVGHWADLELGGDGDFQRFWPRSEQLGAEDQDVFHTRTAVSAGGYAGLTMRLPARLSVSPGFRLDSYFEQGAHKYEPGPRLSVRFRPFGDVWLKGAIGRYSQMASLAVSVSGFEGFGLRTYGTQSSLQGSLGVEAPVSHWFSLDLTGFYQRLRLTDLRSVSDVDIQKDILEVRDGQSYGVEALLRRSSNERFYGWVAYTLSWSYRLVGYYLSRSFSDWDQRHIFNLVAGYRIGRGYSVSGRVHYNTGRPFPVFNERDANPPDYTRLPPFYQLDLRADKRFVFDRYTLDVYAEFVNSTLTREVFDLRRRPDGTLNERGYRIVLPSIGVHAEW